MKTIGNVQKDGQVRAVASGALTDGTPVIVNADGTVSVVGIGAASIGTEVQFEAGNSNYLMSTYDTLNDKVVIAYQDNGNSNYGTAVVGTVSGTSISFGTPVVFKSATIEYGDITFDSNSNKVVIAYRLSPGGDHGKAIVGTVSGTSISFGSEVTYNSGTTDNISCDFDSTHNRVVVAFRDVGAGSPFPGKAIVGSVSGTSISFGQEVRFKNANITDTTVSFDSSSEKIVIAYRDNTNSNQGIAIVGDVEPSNNSISFGSEVVFETTATQYTRAVYDSGNNKTNIFYMDGGDSDKGKAVIGTVSGTSISFTSPSNFYTDAGINALTAVYDSNAAKSVIGIRGASAYGYAIPITSDGSSFTVGS